MKNTLNTTVKNHTLELLKTYNAPEEKLAGVTKLVTRPEWKLKKILMDSNGKVDVTCSAKWAEGGTLRLTYTSKGSFAICKKDASTGEISWPATIYSVKRLAKQNTENEHEYFDLVLKAGADYYNIEEIRGKASEGEKYAPLIGLSILKYNKTTHKNEKIGTIIPSKNDSLNSKGPEKEKNEEEDLSTGESSSGEELTLEGIDSLDITDGLIPIDEDDSGISEIELNEANESSETDSPAVEILPTEEDIEEDIKEPEKKNNIKEIPVRITNQIEKKVKENLKNESMDTEIEDRIVHSILESIKPIITDIVREFKEDIQKNNS